MSKTRTFCTRFLAIFLMNSLILFSISLAAQPTKSKKVVVVALDLSDSAPVVADPQFRMQAARYLTEQVMTTLALASEIRIVTLGEFDLQKNGLSFAFTLLNTPGKRPQDVAQTIKALILGVPTLIERGGFQLQNRTAILGSLQVLAERLPQDQEVEIVVLSDLLEYSDEANAYELIKQTKGRFPPAPANVLSGVSVTALGAGYGVKSNQEYQQLKSIWETWMHDAGTKSFVFRPVL